MPLKRSIMYEFTEEGNHHTFKITDRDLIEGENFKRYALLHKSKGPYARFVARAPRGKWYTEYSFSQHTGYRRGNELSNGIS